MALYHLPPAPSGDELVAHIDRALATAQAARDRLGGANEHGVWENVTGSLARLVQRDYNAGANRNLDGAITLLRLCRDEAQQIGQQAAGGDLLERVRTACTTVEQESGGVDAVVSNNERNRAELADDLTDPSAYVGAAVGGFAPAAAGAAPNLPNLKNPLAGLKTWVYVVGGIVLLAVVVGLYLRMRGNR